MDGRKEKEDYDIKWYVLTVSLKELSIVSEIETSIFNKNSLIYGSTYIAETKGPNCVARKGEDVFSKVSQPTKAPIKAVREK